MALQPVLIDGAWRDANAPAGSFHAVNPTTRTEMPEEYPVSSIEDVDDALIAAQDAVAALRSLSPDRIGEFLDAYAANIEARAVELVEMAYLESALPREPRLNSVELPRTVNQLRQAAEAVRNRSWTHATIDTKLNIRSMYRPLGGAVVVMGPNNFPFAFNSAAGGDFTAAIAAGNPVIAKANTSHPGTTRLFAEAALDAITATGMPRALVQLIYRTPPDVGFGLVSHPLTAATGFTGSRSAGMRLKDAADRAGKPIYLEMSSINPVIFLPGALKERGDELAAEFAASCLLGVGQFCTNPGFVILLENATSAAFTQKVAETFAARAPGVLLGSRSPRDLSDAVEVMRQNGAELVVGGNEVADGGYGFDNTLLRVDGETFLSHAEALQTEAFGPVSLFVVARDQRQILDILSHVEGNLTGAIYSSCDGADDALYDVIEPALRARVGRLLNDKMPTGVAVSPAMNHGGPYPATGHPGWTAVGIPWSLLRFGALQSYDNVRAHRLPVELQDRNPTGRTWRFVDGEWTQRDL